MTSDAGGRRAVLLPAAFVVLSYQHTHYRRHLGRHIRGGDRCALPPLIAFEPGGEMGPAWILALPVL